MRPWEWSTFISHTSSMVWLVQAPFSSELFGPVWAEASFIDQSHHVALFLLSFGCHFCCLAQCLTLDYWEHIVSKKRLEQKWGKVGQAFLAMWPWASLWPCLHFELNFPPAKKNTCVSAQDNETTDNTCLLFLFLPYPPHSSSFGISGLRLLKTENGVNHIPQLCLITMLSNLDSDGLFCCGLLS